MLLCTVSFAPQVSLPIPPLRFLPSLHISRTYLPPPFANWSRPDTSFPIGFPSHFQTHFSLPYLNATNRFLLYLSGSLQHDITYQSSSTTATYGCVDAT